MIPGSRMQLWTFLADRTYQRDIKPVPTLSCGGVFRYRSGERLHGMQEVTGSIPVFSTIQFVLEPNSLRERVRVRFLFTGGSAEGLLGTVNEQRQGIIVVMVSCLLFCGIVVMVSCLLFCGIKFALCELGRPPIWLTGGNRCIRAYRGEPVHLWQGVTH